MVLKICLPKLTTDDIETHIIDIALYMVENPGYTLPPQYLHLLSKIVTGELEKLRTDAEKRTHRPK